MVGNGGANTPGGGGHQEREKAGLGASQVKHLVGENTHRKTRTGVRPSPMILGKKRKRTKKRGHTHIKNESAQNVHVRLKGE